MRNNFKIFIFAPFLIIPLLAFPFSCSSLKTSAGIFVSFDRGENWQKTGKISKDESLAEKNILSIGFDPTNQRVIYVGTAGEGFFKTLDAGDLWYLMEDPGNSSFAKASVYDVAIDPTDGNRLYLAAFSQNYGHCFRSDDGGVSWEQVYKTSEPKKTVLAVAIDERNPQNVYLATEEGGVLRSSDFGKSWQALKWFGRAASSVAVDPKNSSVLYVGTWGSGLFKTIDQGTTWQEVEVQESTFGKVKDVQAIAINSQNSSNVFVAFEKGIFQSTDAGQSWQEIKTVIPPNSLPILTFELNQKNVNEFYCAAGSVIYRSGDGGKTWEVYPQNTTGSISTIKINPHYTENVMVGIRE